MTVRLNGGRLKKWLKWILMVFSMLYILEIILASLPQTPQCPVEEHFFNGQAFDIEICMSYASDKTHFGMRVYSKEGEHLARRMSTFAKEGSLNYMAIEDDKIRYSDDTSDLRSTSIPEDCVLHMPPTWVDWIEARLPGGIPGVNHCGVASDEITEKARQSWRSRLKAERLKEEAAMHEQNATTKAASPMHQPAVKPASSK
jgi:hypothetical protein